MNNKKKKVINIIKYTFSLFFILLTLLNINIKGGIIEKQQANSLKTLDQEGQNYRLVTSADNVQVPVPKGYVASEVSGENYVTPEYRHTQISHKGNYTELNWNSPEGEQYPWTQDENGIWISGNKGIPNSTSTLESEEFTYIKGTTLTINYTYSCQNSYYTDYLNIYLIEIANNKSTTIVSDKLGNTSTSFNYLTSNYTYTMSDWGTGRYKIRVTYSKNSSIDEGQDSGYIKSSTYFKEDENGENIEVDQKTKIHDGGFVIYQLTDEELETDPNGTNVIINDTNKDDAQSERNQYVWVPVENIEDISRTKTANTGIMQFGQNYSFSNTAITKETSTDTNSYREPRLAENIDKTKYYLQRYIDINNRQSYLNNQQDDFSRMIESINKYKGFYIGRYETGDDYTHSFSKGCFTNPKIVRYNNNINYVTWYDSNKDLQRLSGKTEKYVETGMIYDSLWDYTLKWLNETDTRSYKDIYSDSGTWGSYTNNTKTTSSGGTNLAKTGAIETITYKVETYSDSPTASNNIFDLAGNAWEWTRSRSLGSSRKMRGGNYSSGSIIGPAYSSSSSNPSSSYYDCGVRSVLLIR